MTLKSHRIPTAIKPTAVLVLQFFSVGCSQSSFGFFSFYFCKGKSCSSKSRICDFDAFAK